MTQTFECEATEPIFGINIGMVTLSNVHDNGKCLGEYCVIHNPSNHHMEQWPLVWRSDKMAMERTCSHGVGHPDPDDLGFT